jgi:hypothetical protein
MTAVTFSCSQIYVFRAESGYRLDTYDFGRESTIHRQTTTTFNAGMRWLSRTARHDVSTVQRRDGSSQDHR